MTGIEEWLKDATPKQVAERLAASELNALLWHVATLTMSPDEVKRAEAVGRALIAGGYEGHIRGN
jgi:hypothetical protein